jgi:hypothetical protein
MIKRYQKTAVSQYIIVGAILIALVIVGYLSTLVMKKIPFIDHFALPWAAGRSWLLEGENPYDPSVIQIAEKAIFEAGFSGRLPERPVLIQPLNNLFFYLPLSLLPYSISRAIWVVLLAIISGFIIHLALKFSEWKLSKIEKIGVITLLILWFPGIFSIITGHLFVVIIFLVMVGFQFLKSGKYQQAGFILALTMGSLPLTLFVIILAILWSISRRQWSFLVALISGIGFLIILSLLMLSSWPLDWLRTVFSVFQDFEWVQTPLMMVASVLPGVENFLSISLHTAFGLILLALWINLFTKGERVFVWNTLGTLVIVILFQPQIVIGSLFLIIPPLFLVLRFTADRWKRFGRLAVWFTLLMISAGSWFLHLPEASLTELISLPALTIGLPLFVFIGMIWIRWWATRLTRLPQF